VPRLIEKPTVVEAAGNVPKKIEELVGRLNTGHEQVSVARMKSPEGWVEPGQTPEFMEITVVLEGCLLVEHQDGSVRVPKGKAIITQSGEWVRYSSPDPGGCEYIAVCLPAFSPDTVHRDDE
jgi:mannose-6-phosphate isomerase-like protein (cupin superfamily)